MGILKEIDLAVDMPLWLFDSIFSINRWFHLLASTLLVGGVLFFVLVVPIATSDLPAEHRFAVFGRARWIFRKIVLWSVLVIIVSGALSLWRMAPLFSADHARVHSFWFSSVPWAWAHVIVSLLGAAILLRVTATRNIRDHPIAWMWTALTILLLTMMLASITRQIRLSIDERWIPKTAYQATR